MTFSRIRSTFLRIAALVALATGLTIAVSASSFAKAPVALVPTKTIYPGEVLTGAHVEAVEVTNPNLSGGYASEVHQIDGLIAKQTLLAGRTIPLAALRVPAAVIRGTNVRLVFTIGNLTLSASGAPLTDGAVGDVVRARNLDSGVIVSGTVMRDGTIQVMAK